MGPEGPLGGGGRPPENEGVELYELPEWVADALTSYAAIDQAFTSLTEDDGLEAFGLGPKGERRALLMQKKADARGFAAVIGMISGELTLRKSVWTEPSALAAASAEEREEFYRPHVENMKRRITNFVRNLEEAGKKVPKIVKGRGVNRIYLLDPRALTLSVEGGKGKIDFGDWFGARWEDEILMQTRGISRDEKMGIVAHASF